MIAPVGVYANATGDYTTVANGQLGKADFLKLLVAELRYQDPLNPMSSTEMTAQMAQFSELEQMLNMGTAFEQLQTVSMLGKIVTALSYDGTSITGRVTRVNLNGNTPILILENGSVVALKDVQEVSY